jgi:hypothetical protein
VAARRSASGRRTYTMAVAIAETTTMARMATPATRNAHGAWAPMAATTSVMDRKMPSTGARLASVEDSVSNRLSAPSIGRDDAEGNSGG